MPPIFDVAKAMEIFEGGPLSEAKEKYPDILLAQLLDSSIEFREWLVNRTTSAQKIVEYHGVRCNETTYNRETDLMFGFKGSDGNDYLVLVENKIKAQEQPRQLFDYHKRGESYVNRGVCDQYSVCLLSPKKWAKPEVRDKVDRVLSYEEVMDRLDTLDHDGAEFTQAILSQSVNKSASSVSDYSHVTEELWQRVTEESSHELQKHSVTGKHVRCTSVHPDHPNFVIYNIYLEDVSEFGHSNLRLQLSFDENTWPEAIDTEKERLKIQFGDAIDRLLKKRNTKFREEYKNTKTQRKTVISKQLPYESSSQFESEGYYHTITAEFCDLIEKVHPVIIDIDFRDISQKLT